MSLIKISALTSYTPLLDADVLPVVDTANATTKKITWANFKLSIKTYTDTLYLTTSSSGVLTNKSLSDSTTFIVDVADNTKRLQFDVAGTTAVTGVLAFAFTTAKTITFQDVTDTVVMRTTTDTLTNKTLTTPTITKPVMSATNPTAQSYSPGAGGTATLDLSLSNQHDITMPAGNITIALSNDTNNQMFTISITQDGTGSRTVTWFSTIRWATGAVPTLTTTASKRDMFIFKRTGSGTYDGFVVGQAI